jgi:hypothetical protein
MRNRACKGVPVRVATRAATLDLPESSLSSLVLRRCRESKPWTVLSLRVKLTVPILTRLCGVPKFRSAGLDQPGLSCLQNATFVASVGKLRGLSNRDDRTSKHPIVPRYSYVTRAVDTFH